MQEREGACRRGGEGGSMQERGRGREHAGEGEREGACRRGGEGGSMQERGRGREHAGEGGSGGEGGDNIGTLLCTQREIHPSIPGWVV